MDFGNSGGSREDGEVLSFEDDNPVEEQHEDAPAVIKFFGSKSERGKDILIRDGFEYGFDKISKKGDEGRFLPFSIKISIKIFMRILALREEKALLSRENYCLCRLE